MKTKLIMPWKIRPGMLTYTYYEGRPEQKTFYRVAHVSKGRSAFTGGTVWEVTFTGDYPPHRTAYHGRGLRLPAEKFLQVIEEEKAETFVKDPTCVLCEFNEGPHEH